MTVDQQTKDSVRVFLVLVSDCIEGSVSAGGVSHFWLHLVVEEDFNGMRGAPLGSMHQNVFAVFIPNVVDIC